MARIVELVRELDGDLPQLLVDSAVDYAIIVLDAKGNVVSWNPGAERIKGWMREEILGKHFSVFYAPEDIASGKPWRALHQVEADGRLADRGWRMRKDGSLFWADVVITALRDSDGVLVGFAKVTRDLTDHTNPAVVDDSLAALQERERIAKVLHHTVVRTLFGIGLSLQAGAAETDDEKLRARLQSAIHDLDKAIREVRGHVFGQDASRNTPTPPRGRASSTGTRPSNHDKSRQARGRGGSPRRPRIE